MMDKPNVPMYTQVSTTWVARINRLIGEAQSLTEAARDGRHVPVWLEERLKRIEILLELL
jgi:hypothetical protein